MAQGKPAGTTGGEPSPAPAPARPRVGKTGYGIDEPRSIIMLVVAGVLAIVVGFVISDYMKATDATIARLGLLVGPAIGLLILAVGAALYWSSRQGRVTEVHKIIGSIPWGGNEVVLDLGCGRGLAMVSAARVLDQGYTVGVDMWVKSHLSGNDPRSIFANAAVAKVGDKVVPVKADPVHLPFVRSSIDVMVSGNSFHRLVKRRDREAAFKEVIRVLKEGGRIGIVDAGNGGEYARILRSLGMSDLAVKRLRFSSFPPFHVVLARKPFAG